MSVNMLISGIYRLISSKFINKQGYKYVDKFSRLSTIYTKDFKRRYFMSFNYKNIINFKNKIRFYFTSFVSYS